MQVILYEDSHARAFGPLTLLRPVFELRCGALVLREKLERRRPDWPIALSPRPELARVVSEELSGREPGDLPSGPTLLLSAAVLIDDALLDFLESLNGNRTILSGGRVVGALLESGCEELDCAGPQIPQLLEGLGHEAAVYEGLRVVDYPWQLVEAAPGEIGRDAALVEGRGRVSGVVSDGASIVEPERLTVGEGSSLGAGVVVDASAGEVIIGRDVRIMPNSVLVGPLSVGDGSLVRAGTRIYGGTVIGPVCKVGGEISASIVQSHSNKQHDGFLGHSFVGSWVNLGAGTDTSDLRNNYGEAKVELNGETIETGLSSVGATIGDHSKTAIGTKLNTGTVVGVFCNVFPGVFPPKSISSFSWGTADGFVRYDLEKAIATARAVMSRRGVELTEARESLIRDVYARTA